MSETSASGAITDLWAVVPAGGAGTRLWPLSRASAPKFLLDLTGTGRTLLQGTVDRLRPLVGEQVLVVTGAVHRERVIEQLPELDPMQVMAEPSPRDSMAAVGWAAAVLEATDPDCVLASFAADHVIPDGEAFRETVRIAADAARAGWLVTIGIEPTGPATEFGYIHVGAELDGRPGARHVLEFVEKPSAAVAADYLATGEYRWNAGMFVVRPGVLLDLLAEQHPDLAAGLRAIVAGELPLGEGWPGLTKIALDHAVAEPAAAAGRVAVVPGDFGWDDVGGFASLTDLLADQPTGPRVLGDASLVRASGSTGLVVPASGRVVAVLGLEDVVIVDTDDALLVTTRAHAQDVKAVVNALKAEGRTDLT